MKHKLAVLTVLGALVALVVPASSSASMYPAAHAFEISGGGKVGTSLGSCLITKVTGSTPSAPANESAGSANIAVPTVSGCTAGTTLTLGGTWALAYSGGPLVNLGGGSATLTMKFSSLPGCKLSTSAPTLQGLWLNGYTAPKTMLSSFHAHSAGSLTWSEEGGSCALKGKTETVSFTAETTGPFVVPQAATVNDTTSPGSLVIVGANK